MEFLSRPRVIAALRVLFWAALVFAVVMALLPKPIPNPTDRLGDKVQHMLAFATLSFLGALAYPVLARWRLALALIALGSGIEAAQMIPMLKRTASLLDFAADAVVTVLVTGLMALILPRRA